MAPPAVHDVLRTPGAPLAPSVQAEMGARLGHDFSRIRIHSDPRAAHSARAVNAEAYTVGTHVVFDAGRYAPSTGPGRALLAHELVHTMQHQEVAGGDLSIPASLPIGDRDHPDEREAERLAASSGIAAAGAPSRARGGALRPALRRFEKTEKPKIGTMGEMLAEAKAAAEAAEMLDGGVAWGDFVTAMGGATALGTTGKSTSGGGQLAKRYVFSCRCGLLDMRHFFQLMYIARLLWNSKATEKGREHELNSEATSRFAPEDTPSNALGAFFGSELGGGESAGEFIGKLRRFLRICEPIDFSALPAADQDAIVDFYGGRDSSGAPSNPNETARPDRLSVSGCARPDRSFPFKLDKDDPDKKTISGYKKPFGLTSDTDIRDWVAKQSSTTLRNLPTFEKIRLVNRLLDGWVSDDDMTAIESICGSVDDGDEMTRINGAVHSREGELSSDEHKKRFHAAVSRVP